MKKIIVIILGILGALLLILGLMFLLNICPPNGPWMMPPWCKQNAFERIHYDLQVDTKPLSQIKAVNMFDTWGRNYNFGMIENTRNQINDAFDLVKEMGAEEVYVHDFHRAVYNEEEDFKSLDYKIVDEIFTNDFRDESMNEKDIKRLAVATHERGLKIGIKHNIAFVNIGKYIVKGLTGEIAASVEEDFKAFNAEHSEEWIRDFFMKWKNRLIERAEIYNKYGVDILSITPTWMGPTFQGHEALANEQWKQLIAELRNHFDGKIHTELSIYGLLDGRDGQEKWSAYDYYQSADIQEIRLFNFLDPYRVSPNPDLEQMRIGMKSILRDLDTKAAQNNIALSIQFLPFSYKNAINEGIIEFYDIKDERTNKEKDFEHQADAYQVFFEEVRSKKNIERVVAGGFWWDDAMDPAVKPKISLSPSFRNKPAEEVIKQWYLAK